jgi:hypothetical protein
MISARLCLAMALVTAPIQAVLAQTDDRAPGRAAARAFAAPPAPLAFAIEPGDNSDENMALADRIAKEAPRSGIGVQPKGAGLVLRFDTEVRADAPAQRPNFSRPGGGVGDPDDRTPDPPETRDEVTNLLTSRGSGVLNRRPQPGSGSERLLRYVINASLEDTTTGRRLWQGHVSYDTNTPDRKAMFVALAPVLVEQIGKSVQERTFRLE